MPTVVAVVAWMPAVVGVVVPMMLRRGDPRNIWMMRWIVSAIRNVDSCGGFLSC